MLSRLASSKVSRKLKREARLLFLGQPNFPKPFMQVSSRSCWWVDGALSFFDTLRQGG